MLGKAKTILENLQASWNVSGSYSDDFQMWLYAAVEEEFDSGYVKKGLLAKINVESGYNEKITKAKYIKVRVDGILLKKEELRSKINKLSEIDRLIEKEEKTVASNYEFEQPKYRDSDYEAADRLIEDECNKEIAIRTEADNRFKVFYYFSYAISLIFSLVFLAIIASSGFSIYYFLIFSAFTFFSGFSFYFARKKTRSVAFKVEELKRLHSSSSYFDKVLSKVAEQRFDNAKKMSALSLENISYLKQDRDDLLKDIYNILS